MQWCRTIAAIAALTTTLFRLYIYKLSPPKVTIAPVLLLPGARLSPITGRLGRSENEARIFLTYEKKKKNLFCVVKMHTLKKFAAALCATKLTFPHMANYGLYTSSLLPMLM